MKKLFLLFSIIMCFFTQTNYAQTFTASPTTVASGGTVTVTGNGEGLTDYFSILNSDFLSPTNTPVTVSVQQPIKYYNTATATPTSFKITLTNPTSTAQTVSVWFVCTVNNQVTGAQNTNYETSISVTVSPASTGPTTYTNAAQSKAFTKNSCGTGYQGSQVTYTVAAGKYTSTVSQADANSKATADINANGQNYANTNGSCAILYYNTAQSGSLPRNNCTIGTGSTVAYNIPANTYSSTVSQADANQLAINAGQAYANANGTCTTIYVKLTNTGVGTITTSGTVRTTTVPYTLSFFSDAAATQPLALPNPLSVIINTAAAIIHTSSGSSSSTSYSVPAGVTTYSLGPEVIETADSSVGFYGTTVYTITLGSNGTYIVD